MNALIVGLVRDVEHTLSECVLHDPQRHIFCCLGLVLTRDVFEAFFYIYHGSVFNKTVLCLGEKRGIC